MTYAGYGQGSTQIIYGLAHREEEKYQALLNGAISLAPCIKVSTPLMAESKRNLNYDMYKGYEAAFDLYD